MDKIKENVMKEKAKEYKRRLRLVLKSKLNGKNKITAINVWAVTLFRYGAVMLQWKDRESTERCGQEIKENNDNVWSVTPEE